MFYFLGICFLALFDIVATHYQIVVYNTYAIEANPFMRWVMETYGMTVTYILRMAVPMIIIPPFLFLKEDRREVIWILRFFLFAHFLLACWHIYLTNCFTIHL
jgi:hypothetical protein